MFLTLMKSKLVIGFSLFGMFLSLLLGLLSGIALGFVLLRMLISGFIMGGIGVGVFLLLRSVLSEEEMNSLLALLKNESREDTSVSESTNASGSNVDVTDDTELEPSDLFDKPVESPKRQESANEFVKSSEENEDKMFEEDSFKEVYFSESAPKIQPIENDLSNSAPKQPAYSGGKSAKIQVKDRSLEVDPETGATLSHGALPSVSFSGSPGRSPACKSPVPVPSTAAFSRA